ncbi:MAG TPA: biotin-dependent carboxyltransferase family protein [Vicinamibacterales bacterium]|nr:biotin-dependent carboxyltransferase family protein [Vicinamibacterales bacterium]
MSAGAVQVVRPGLLTTVQDLGRWGHQSSGVAVAGPMDTFSHRMANALVGNAADAATLEITLIGPELEFDAPTMIAVCGAEFDVTCNGQAIAGCTSAAVPRGGRVQFGRRRAGARAYLAVADGFQIPALLGSRATHVVSAMGGVQGRALIAGDRLPIAATAVERVARRGMPMPLPQGRARLRVMAGPQAEWFTPQAMRTLTTVGFVVSPRSNRMGYRLEGPSLPRARGGEPISEPVTFGAIQVPPAGEPILLMADRQTAGGYPKIAAVIAADLPIAGQLAPGDIIEFAACTRQEAAAALIARERPLLRVSSDDQRA